MPTKYHPIGFSYKEHQKYAQLCKIAALYAPSFNYAHHLGTEMETLLGQDHKNIDYCKDWRSTPMEGKLYDPYLGLPEPNLPFYSLNECCEALQSLITNLKVSDSPKCTEKAQKLALKSIKMLEKVKDSKHYADFCDIVERVKERCIEEREPAA